MPCDERYRAWAMRPRPQATGLLSPGVRRARLTGVVPCPARPGFRELRFDVDGTAWSWCFAYTPQPASGTGGCDVQAVALRPGPHGLAADAVAAPDGSSLRAAPVDPATAAELAISGIPVYLHPSLVSPAGTPGSQQARQPGGTARA